jgi:UDP-glucose:(heptosyl)LPS alpha-1,3-glucosyltransferase
MVADSNFAGCEKRHQAMRLAITIEKLDLRRGGAEGAAAWLIEQLAGRGHEVHVLTRDLSVDLPLGVRYRHVNVRWPVVAMSQWAFAREVARRLDDGRYDLSIACGRGFAEDVVWAQNGAQAAAIEGQARSYYYSPLLRTLRRLQHCYSVRAWCYRELERRRFARQPQPYILAVSEMVARDFQRCYGVNRDRIHVVHNQVVIDTRRFSPDRLREYRDSARAAMQISRDALVILCVAQNFRRKGVRPLLEAAAKLLQHRRKFCVVVAGGTPKHSSPYRRFAERLGCEPHVRFIGHRRHVEELYAAADLFCLPTFYDPCSLTVFEAMACGLPVITTRYNGAAEFVQDGRNGYVLAEPHDSDAMAAQFERFFDEKLRRQMSAAALETTRTRWTESSAEHVVRFLETVAARKSSLAVVEPVPAISPAPSA